MLNPKAKDVFIVSLPLAPPIHGCQIIFHLCKCSNLLVVWPISRIDEILRAIAKMKIYPTHMRLLSHESKIGFSIAVSMIGKIPMRVYQLNITSFISN